MNKDIELEDIKYFKEIYESELSNKEIENKIKKVGLREASLDDKDYEFKFNIEVPNIKIYNQYNSRQCDIYAFLRVVKDILVKNKTINNDEIEISANYIAFYDKLEKINTLYNELISYKNLTLEIINNKVNRYIGSYGTFHFCKEIVNKYGLVLKKDMKDVNSKFDENLVIELLRNKIKIDALSLINSDDKKVTKKELMKEAYKFLSKVYGNPPSSFIFENKEITPIEFKEKYLKNSLDDFVTVTSIDKDVLFDSYAFIPNIYLNNDEKIIRLSLNKIQDAIIRQLKDNVSVWFSAEESTTLDYENGILDNTVYEFNSLLNIKNVSKKDKMKLDIINYDHAMCITGVLYLNGEIKQYKVANSFGSYGKYNGNLIMTPDFLKNYVITLIIDKKYIE